MQGRPYPPFPAYGMARPAMERDDDSTPRRQRTGNSGERSQARSAGAEIRQLKPRQGKPAKSKPRPYERPRGGPARAVADLVPQIGRTAFRKFGFVQSSVLMRWPEIVGPQHARLCMPEMIRFPGGPSSGEKRAGTLHLVVLPAHAPLIQHVVPEIITRVNRFFGYEAVAQVRLRQGEVQPPRDEGVRPAPPTLRPVALELGESLRDVGDSELRTVLESLARSLSREDDEGEETR